MINDRYVPIYSIECDNCKHEYYNDQGDEFLDREVLQELAEAAGWNLTDSDEGNTYCPDCWELDDNNELIIKPLNP